MNKSELIDQIAQKTNLQKNVATQALDAAVNSITDALRASQVVTIIGFGTFQTKQRQERIGRNPKTGESMTIPASKSISFKAGKGLKEIVNK